MSMTVPERPVLVAPDSFKGTIRASVVAGAIGRGLERAGLMPPDLCPVADGGEDTMDALLPGLGGELVVEVTFDHTSNDRIRHGAKISRWRDDKDPAECRMDQLLS